MSKLNTLVVNEYATMKLGVLVDAANKVEVQMKEFPMHTPIYKNLKLELSKMEDILEVFSAAKEENEDLARMGQPGRYHIDAYTSCANIIETMSGKSWAEIVEQYRPKNILAKSTGVVVSGTKSVSTATVSKSKDVYEKTVDTVLDGLFKGATWLAGKTKR